MSTKTCSPRAIVGRLVEFGSSHRFWTGVALFCIALVVRSIYILTFTSGLTFDEPHFHDIASRLVSGQGYTFSSDAFYIAVTGQPTSYQEPVYPLFLSGVFAAFGSDNYVGARLCQALVASVVPVAVYLAGERAVGRGVGLAAGLLLTAWPSLVYFGGLLMTETMAATLLSVGLCVVALSAESAPGYRDVLFGVVFGLAVLTRGVILGFLPVFCVWLWWHYGLRQALRRALLTALGCAVVVLPWTIRNYIVHRAFIPVSTKLGIALYIWSYPVRDFDFNHRWDTMVFPDVEGLSELERSRLLTSEAIGFIRGNPLLFAESAVYKLIDFWNPIPKTDNRLLVLVNALSFGVAALLTVVGLVLLIRRREARKPFVILCYAVVGYYMLQCIIFTGGMKARLPVEPFMVLLAVYAASLLLRQWFPPAAGEAVQ